MAEYIQYTLEDGSSILIETTTTHPGGGPVGVEEQVKKSFKGLRETLTPLAHFAAELKNTVTQKLPQPEEVCLEFGAKIAGDVGIIIAKSQVEANIKITLKWKAAAKP
ncbi:CU044_2847 family protein [Dawidia soli]|uniref:Trypsin-co-occurring domain-containing protein n=1 Tax=Dawidia soli TaxID=2782352 RepID=A0AAP2DD09_9BACT|nr:CU044_2847 family protein [Dawidia soli]MBT1687117.1 hypothetical protein [Dawidia soli]